MSCCSYCGTQRAALKRCSRCKQASYCGTKCQHAAWKGHKTTCVTLDEVFEKVNAANLQKDWRELLKWEGRMEEMMESGKWHADSGCNVLAVFSDAHRFLFNSTGSIDNALSVVRLGTRRAELLGKVQRFRDQGGALQHVADYLLLLGQQQEAEGYFQRVRKIAEAHGFFSAECDACLGLGRLAMAGGRDEEGVELLRNALVCVPLCEKEDTIQELSVLHTFVNALFHTQAIDEVEPLVARMFEVTKAASEQLGRLHLSEFHILYESARLHEVLCMHLLPVLGALSHTALPLHSTKADSVCDRSHLARVNTPALVEPPAPFRHAGGLKRPRGRCVPF